MASPIMSSQYFTLAINDSAVAQIPSIPTPMPLVETTLSQVNVLFVNPSVKNNITDNSSDRTS